MDQVKCRMEIPAVEGLEAAELTVGRHFILSCEGDWNKIFDFGKAQVKTEENYKYLVKVLKAEARNASSFDLDMTFYIAGQAKFPEMILSDGTNEISLGQQQFEVKSVLQQPAEGQPPQKPFGFIFPIRLEWPNLYFILAGIAIVLFLIGLIYQVRRAARYAKLIADLRQYSSTIDPDLQFYKSVRASEKENYPLGELENAFRLYVLRVFEVPMFVLNNRQIVQFFKKRKSIYKQERLIVGNILGEFEEIRKTGKDLATPEKLELLHKMYRFVDRTHNVRKAR